MKFSNESLLLYGITERSYLQDISLEEAVEQSLIGGTTCIQLREKQLCDADFLQEALALQALCARYSVPFIVNDRVEIALQIEADGIHVGQDDMNATDVRALIGPDKILGVSAQTVHEALDAQAAGADYLGVGAVFTTQSKDDAKHVSFEMLQEICAAVTIPVVAIGGISYNNVDELRNTGIAGVAVISALYKQTDITKASLDMKTKLSRLL